MRKSFTSVLVPFLLVLSLPLENRLWAEDDLLRFTAQQLNTAMVKSGLSTQRISSIQSVVNDRGQTDLAILSSSRSGWRVTVLQRVPGGFHLQWQSGKLPDDITVSTSDSLKIETLDDGERVVQFSGCAAHECAGKEGAFGVLLYSPRANQVFLAHYRFDGKRAAASVGPLGFSENANERGHEKYKAALQKTMERILR